MVQYHDHDYKLKIMIQSSMCCNKLKKGFNTGIMKWNVGRINKFYVSDVGWEIQLDLEKHIPCNIETKMSFLRSI